jgi:hypothetical protein
MKDKWPSSDQMLAGITATSEQQACDLVCLRAIINTGLDGADADVAEGADRALRYLIQCWALLSRVESAARELTRR